MYVCVTMTSTKTKEGKKRRKKCMRLNRELALNRNFITETMSRKLVVKRSSFWYRKREGEEDDVPERKKHSEIQCLVESAGLVQNIRAIWWHYQASTRALFIRVLTGLVLSRAYYPPLPSLPTQYVPFSIVASFAITNTAQCLPSSLSLCWICELLLPMLD